MNVGQAFHAFRLKPGDDLRKSLDFFCKEKNIAAGTILSCVGSLDTAVLRFAGRESGTTIVGNLEIVSATGTLSQHGMHVHIAVADANGDMAGGHLMDGCRVRTTCEIVIQEFSGMVFKREHDPNTGYDEISIRQK